MSNINIFRNLIVASTAVVAVRADAAPAAPLPAVASWDGTAAFAVGRCQNVYATSAMTADYVQRPNSIFTDSCGFQCVELAVRYFHYRKNIPASSWRVGTATAMCAQHPPGVSQATKPVPGDLVVIRPGHGGTGDVGHVAIVTKIRENGAHIDTFNENWDAGRTAFRTVSGGDVQCFLHADAQRRRGSGPAR